MMVLTDLKDVRDDDMQQYNAYEAIRDEDDDSPTPVFDCFLNNRSEHILNTTNFSVREFNAIWQTCAYGGKDMLFMTMVILKNGEAWDFLGSLFGIRGASF
ncbi:hypothetical protein H310_10044 [Aphanomyces invadans]|uniref:Uncharacterized protein n=1 Tax=Aphanomyces invadans TaxID=157072 RepID=A0A024TTR2_9STRA|nr:hypothetical protein H310_10044 [Aphanomyces invadans]ETV96727.1 hypothetical protein H310_10044 [Aphanomyces invadans]|eukprot:XP_008874504.1 hypothetical protein H310_10044 [Aphanomyces invadans]